MTETPKNSPHQVFLVVLGSLIIILGISSLILFFQNRLLRQQISQANAPSPTPFPEASADPTADWNTLSNSNGFTIKYPSNYIIGASAFEPPPPETSTDTIIAPSIEGTTNSIFDKPHIRILALNSQGKTLLQAATENYNANANHPNKPRAITKPESGTFLSKTSIDYQMESTGLVSPADEYLGFDGLYKVRWVEHNNKYFMIYWNEDPTINQILSTFRFTESEQTDEMSDWETYKDTDISFEIKYPPEWKLRKTYGKSVNNTGNSRISGVDISTDLTFGSTVVANVIDPQDESLVNWVKQSSGVSYTGTETNYTHNGFPAILTEIQREGRPNISNLYYEEKGYIVYLSVNSSLADLSTANEIISTFKFTN